MLCDQAGAQIITAAGAIADDQIDGPAAIEIGDGVGLRRSG